jgi:hypothetical protein
LPKVKSLGRETEKLDCCQIHRWEFPLEGFVRFEVEIRGYSGIKSRVVWPEAEGPWIEGELEDAMLHFIYAGWTAFKKKCAISLSIVSSDESVGIAISEMLSRTIEALGAVEVGEIRMNQEAINSLRRDRIEP